MLTVTSNKNKNMGILGKGKMYQFQVVERCLTQYKMIRTYNQMYIYHSENPPR